MSETRTAEQLTPQERAAATAQAPKRTPEQKAAAGDANAQSAEHPTGGQPPSIGRIVLFRGLDHNGTDVHPAIITRAWPDGSVNLTVMIDAGPPQVATDVEYWDEAEHEHEQQAEPPPPGAPAGPVVEEEVPPPETSWFWPPRV
jgi:hypothetical protein